MMQFLFSCTQNPAVVENRSLLYKNANSDGLSNNPFRVKIEGGDTLYNISKRYGVGIRDLIELNQLRPPYLLVPEQILKLPNAKFHMVGEGDTLYAISRSYGTDLSRLIHINNLEEPYIIKKGTKLRIPSSTESYEPEIQVAQSDVSKGEGKLASIVERDIDKLKTSSKSPKYILPNKVKPDSFDITDSSGNNGSLPKPKLRSSSHPLPNLKPGSRLAANKQKVVKFQAASYSTSSKTFSSKKSSGGFDWPTRGTIISRFGPKKGGLYNDGINIRAAEGTSVVASDSGTVVYAGNELRGYGNLVLLKHSTGYVTAYAHANNVFVKKGEVVKKGQRIASVGSTGHVSVPQLHFSIRKGRKAIDPQSYLPRS